MYDVALKFFRFRWVQCQLDSLSRLRTPGAVREALLRLPPTLDKTYESLLNRIDDEEDKILAREILEILAFVARPLRLHEVSQMLQITPGMRKLDESKCLADPNDILSICGSLLSYQKSVGLVTLAHPSVKTYLTSNLQGNARFFQLSSEKAHKTLAIKCLTYLSFDTFCSGPCSSLESFKERCVFFPLLDYAAGRWAIHLSRLEMLDDSIWTLLKDFLFSGDEGRGNFLSWVQVLTPDLSLAQLSKTTPLYYAASYGLTFVVQFLLDAGADTEVHAGRGGATPINIASFRGHFDVVKLLLERGANPHAVDIYGSERSAIEWAMYNGHKEVFKLLTDNELAYSPDVPQAEWVLSNDRKESIGTQLRDVGHVVISPYWNATGARKRLWWTLIALAEFHSHHPAATVISRFASNYLCLHGTPQTKGLAQSIEIVAGRGVSALVKPETDHDPTTYRVLIGSKILLDAQSNSMPQTPLTPNEALSTIPVSCWIYVAIDDEYAGAIALTDAFAKETASLQDNSAKEALTVIDDN